MCNVNFYFHEAFVSWDIMQKMLSFAVSIFVNNLVRQYIEAFNEFHSIVKKITWVKESVFTGNHFLYRSGDIWERTELSLFCFVLF